MRNQISASANLRTEDVPPFMHFADDGARDLHIAAVRLARSKLKPNERVVSVGVTLAVRSGRVLREGDAVTAEMLLPRVTENGHEVHPIDELNRLVLSGVVLEGV